MDILGYFLCFWAQWTGLILNDQILISIYYPLISIDKKLKTSPMQVSIKCKLALIGHSQVTLYKCFSEWRGNSIFICKCLKDDFRLIQSCEYNKLMWSFYIGFIWIKDSNQSQIVRGYCCCQLSGYRRTQQIWMWTLNCFLLFFDFWFGVPIQHSVIIIVS